MKGALDVHRALLAHAVPHEMVRLPRTIVDADELPAVLGLPTGRCLAVRCYAVSLGPAPFVAVVMRAGDVADPHSLLVALDATAIRPATAVEVNGATDFAAGLVSLIGLPADLPVLADAALGAGVRYFAAGEGRVAVGAETEDLLRACGAASVPLTAVPYPDDDRDLSAGGAKVIDLERRASVAGTARRSPR